MPETAEELSKHQDVREALEQTTGQKTRAPEKSAPREAGTVKTRLIKKLLPALNAAPDKVLFPKGPNR